MATPVGEPHYFFRRGYGDLAEGDLPDRRTLDRATDRHPVMIQAWSPTMPNTCAMNSLALSALGIDKHTPDRVADVWVEKDATGDPTGRLRGAVTTNYNTDPFFRDVLLKLPGPSSELVPAAVLAGITAHHARWHHGGVRASRDGGPPHRRLPPPSRRRPADDARQGGARVPALHETE